ncbi:MAG: phosphoglucosamine mutase [Oscillospiraceae bacterium]|jgi:phosphoglucosamine mutase|nr:phosphoglucosamine mutase [Oscillospiraceae bacterium]
MGRLFGTDGMRGVAITELTCELAMSIGRAAALVLGKNGKKLNILIGKDTRISSDTLEAALIAGITSAGASAELLGVVPTPALALLIREFGADGGIMISASHNTFEDNGIKIFSESGEKLSDESEEEIEKYILDCPEKIILKSGAEIGEIRSFYSGKDTYIKHIIENTGDGEFASGDLRGLKLLFDCANGSACSCACVFTELGAECDFIAVRPNGLNINHNCGSTCLTNLSEKVREGNYHAGVAFDGDADRCLFVDEKGREVSGDKIIALMAKSMKEKGMLKKDTVVVTIMSNLGFHEFMHENGINTISAKVGDRYVYEEMKKGGFNIGGENSGHIILSDYATTGDGLLSAARFLHMLKESGEPLSELVSGIKDYPQKLTGIKITSEAKANWSKNESIIKVIKEAEEFFSGNGRVNVRPSGTEPLIRIMIEGKSESDVEHWLGKIREVVERELCE